MAPFIRSAIVIILAGCFLSSGVALAYCKAAHSNEQADHRSEHDSASVADEHSHHHHNQVENVNGNANKPSDHYAVQDKRCALCTMTAAPLLPEAVSPAISASQIVRAVCKDLTSAELFLDPEIPKTIL